MGTAFQADGLRALPPDALVFGETAGSTVLWGTGEGSVFSLSPESRSRLGLLNGFVDLRSLTRGSRRASVRRSAHDLERQVEAPE